MNDPMALQVLDAVVERLKTISKARDTLTWFSTPATVDVGPHMGDLSKPGTLIFADLVDWSDTPIGAGRHEATVELLVTGSINGSRSPQRDIHKLACDIVKAVALKDNDRLDGLVQSIRATRYTATSEFVETAGEADVVVHVTATYLWSHNAP